MGSESRDLLTLALLEFEEKCAGDGLNEPCPFANGSCEQECLELSRQLAYGNWAGLLFAPPDTPLDGS